jgi:uncharacterized protein with PQ loop repeat
MRIITLPQVPEIFGAGQHYVVAFIIFIAFVFALVVWLARGTKRCIKAIRDAYAEYVKYRKDRDKFGDYEKSRLKD